MKTPCYIFDIDGTIAENSHRAHHIVNPEGKRDWDAWYGALGDDSPIAETFTLMNHLHAAGVPIVLVSGRGAEYRAETEEWLMKHDVPYAALYMRREGDRRNDDIIKLELLVELQEDGFDPIMAFDDRNRVVKAWRSAGIVCAQVAEGDF